MKKSVAAWHFVGDKLRNGQPVPPDGEWLEWTGPLVMCQSGLHASRDPFDALKYAPGNILCRVECAGEIIEDIDKLACSRRKIIERRDATEGLRYFARAEALSVAHLWDPPDVVLEFLMTGDEELRSASAAASRANWAASAAAREASAAARQASWAASAASWAARAAASAASWAASEARAARAAAREARAARAAASEAREASAAASRANWNLLVEEAFENT